MCQKFGFQNFLDIKVILTPPKGWGYRLGWPVQWCKVPFHHLFFKWASKGLQNSYIKMAIGIIHNIGECNKPDCWCMSWWQCSSSPCWCPPTGWPRWPRTSWARTGNVEPDSNNLLPAAPKKIIWHFKYMLPQLFFLWIS